MTTHRDRDIELSDGAIVYGRVLKPKVKGGGYAAGAKYAADFSRLSKRLTKIGARWHMFFGDFGLPYIIVLRERPAQ